MTGRADDVGGGVRGGVSGGLERCMNECNSIMLLFSILIILNVGLMEA